MSGWKMCERFCDVVSNMKIKYARNQRYTHTEYFTDIFKQIEGIPQMFLNGKPLYLQTKESKKMRPTV